MDISKSDIDRRRFARVQITVSGRLLAPDGLEYDCNVDNMSVAGIALTTTARPDAGSTVIVYLDGIGRFEGTVVRHLPSGFAMETAIAGPRLERVAQRLEWQAHQAVHDHADEASGEPRQLGNASMVKFSDGRTAPCKILDLSLSGVLVATTVRPPVNTAVQVGKMAGRVVRHTPDGIDIAFEHMTEPRRDLTRPVH